MVANAGSFVQKYVSVILWFKKKKSTNSIMNITGLYVMTKTQFPLLKLSFEQQFFEQTFTKKCNNIQILKQFMLTLICNVRNPISPKKIRILFETKVYKTVYITKKLFFFFFF